MLNRKQLEDVGKCNGEVPCTQCSCNKEDVDCSKTGIAQTALTLLDEKEKLQQELAQKDEALKQAREGVENKQ